MCMITTVICTVLNTSSCIIHDYFAFNCTIHFLYYQIHNSICSHMVYVYRTCVIVVLDLEHRAMATSRHHWEAFVINAHLISRNPGLCYTRVCGQERRQKGRAGMPVQ